MRQAATYFTGQIKSLRVDLEAAQSKLSAYQQEHGLVSTDNRLDVESARLNDLSSQLVQAQGQRLADIVGLFAATARDWRPSTAAKGGS